MSAACGLLLLSLWPALAGPGSAATKMHGRMDAAPLIDAPCLELGGIIVSVPTARKQASDHGHDLLWELRWLVSHGFLHLLGWDHPNEALLSAMLSCQEQLLGKSGKVLGQREGSSDATSELTTAP